MKTYAQPLISIIIPVYNEAGNLAVLHDELQRHIASLPYRFELLFIDDGSRDQSALLLAGYAERDKRIHLIRFSRNFGKEAAVTAGLRAAQGDAALIIDADLQMPPRLIGEFIAKWRGGAEVVVGVFASRSMSPLKRIGARWFYAIMRRIAHTRITPNATDYRLLDRAVIDAYNHFTERNRITRGLIDWLGFDRDYIYFEQAPRQAGKPAYNFRKLVGLAMNSFTAYSLVPLRLAGYLGVAILTVSLPGGAFLYVERYVWGDYLRLGINSTTMLGVMIIILVGIVLACLGLIALYIAHIHAEVVNRPLYVVRPESAQSLREEFSLSETRARAATLRRAAQPVIADMVEGAN